MYMCVCVCVRACVRARVCVSHFRVPPDNKHISVQILYVCHRVC